MALVPARNSFLRMMLTRAFGIVLSALLLFSLGIYLLLIQPTMERVANAQMQQTSSEMEASIAQLAHGTETILYTLRGVLERNSLSKSPPADSTQPWPADITKLAELNQFFCPQLSMLQMEKIIFPLLKIATVNVFATLGVLSTFLMPSNNHVNIKKFLLPPEPYESLN